MFQKFNLKLLCTDWKLLTVEQYCGHMWRNGEKWQIFTNYMLSGSFLKREERERVLPISRNVWDVRSYATFRTHLQCYSISKNFFSIQSETKIKGAPRHWSEIDTIVHYVDLKVASNRWSDDLVKKASMNTWGVLQRSFKLISPGQRKKLLSYSQLRKMLQVPNTIVRQYLKENSSHSHFRAA